jgi:Serine aminopeptidase, S33
MSTPADPSRKKRTTVRSIMSSGVPRLVGVLSPTMPAAAAWIAERLFLTPPRYAPPERERDLLTRARRGTVRVAGHRIATWTWGAGPRILLVHGWGGRGGQLGAFVEPLVARGFSVAWFDGPAHGASNGRRTTIPELARALDAVADALGPVRGIVAHSGGGVVTGWSVRHRLLAGFVDLPAAIALVAPPADFRGHFERFARACGLASAARTRLEGRLHARVGLPPEAFDLPRFVPDLPVPVLVVHDRDDAEVEWAEGAAVAAAWPGAEFVTTQGLGHHRILRDPMVVAGVTAFLAAHLAADAVRSREPATLATLC